MTTLSVHVKSLQCRVDDLDERLGDQQLKDQERHGLMAERRSIYNQVTELTNRIKQQPR